MTARALSGPTSTIALAAAYRLAWPYCRSRKPTSMLICIHCAQSVRLTVPWLDHSCGLVPRLFSLHGYEITISICVCPVWSLPVHIYTGKHSLWLFWIWWLLRKISLHAKIWPKWPKLGPKPSKAHLWHFLLWWEALQTYRVWITSIDIFQA